MTHSISDGAGYSKWSLQNGVQIFWNPTGNTDSIDVSVSTNDMLPVAVLNYAVYGSGAFPIPTVPDGRFFQVLKQC